MVITGAHPGLEMLQRMAIPNVLAVWLPALAFSLALVIGLKKFDHPATAPVILITSILLFHLVLFLVGVSGDQARSMHWLTPRLVQGGAGNTVSLAMFSQIAWVRVLLLTPMFFSVALIHLTGFLLNTTGLELATRNEFDVNKDLRVTAAANLAAGLVGGPAGFTMISLTMLTRKLGANDRLAGYLTGLVCLIGLFAASLLLQVVPIFLLAGLLMYLGIELLHDWGWKTRLTIPRAEWLISVGILLAIIFIGFIRGLGLGLILCLVFFIWTYSVLPIVRIEGTATSLRSLVDRSLGSHRIFPAKRTA
jgi:SulP family sulfate permease